MIKRLKNTVGDGAFAYGIQEGGFPVRYSLLAFLTRFFIFSCRLLPLLCLSLNSFCQPGGEIGVSGGTGYYLGEYNARHFSNRQTYVSGLYRYNLNDRFALRLNAGFSKMDVRDVKLLPNGTEVYPDGFQGKVRDFSLMLEFNFRSFLVRKTEKSSWWSPYTLAGVGIFTAGDVGCLSVPLGVGMKFNLFRQWSCGVEWTTRKLFSDKVDGLADPWGTGETNFIFNKDWFFVAGFTLTYRFPMNPECYSR